MSPTKVGLAAVGSDLDGAGELLGGPVRRAVGKRLLDMLCSGLGPFPAATRPLWSGRPPPLARPVARPARSRKGGSGKWRPRGPAGGCASMPAPPISIRARPAGLPGAVGRPHGIHLQTWIARGGRRAGLAWRSQRPAMAPISSLLPWELAMHAAVFCTAFREVRCLSRISLSIEREALQKLRAIVWRWLS